MTLYNFFDTVDGMATFEIRTYDGNDATPIYHGDTTSDIRKCEKMLKKYGDKDITYLYAVIMPNEHGNDEAVIVAEINVEE